ncbi:MAG: fumarate/nitrate reduction transcriptional regulator Fnr [Betaproteobacteria bacterium]|nr:fumarate/nitrate reduction transcriptional regulator Fnr [Betaproteobacteria bacterium]MDH5286198.1 fumarate/nitrate reduction transcriptional regulator Fnr [Betaproteobacteria bacterium]
MPVQPRQSPAPAGATPHAAPVISIRDLKSHCTSCSMRELCLPVGLGPDDLKLLDSVIGSRARLKKGESLYRAGEPFHALYAVRLGSLKTTVLAEDGREQVAGYHMLGDIIGLDGIGTDRHGCQATALEDTEVCIMQFQRLEELARKVPALQHNLHRFLAREISRDHGVMLLLGSMRAEERLAVFLVNLSERYRRRGYSSTEFVLRMTREEIGSYLGLKLETVSRLFSRFQDEGVIQVQGRNIKVLEMAALHRLVGQK